jgi:hypothetical protein
VSGPARLPDWDTLAAGLPDVVATMRRYLDQIECVLRLRTVVNTELALRSLAAFLAEQATPVTTVAAVSRRHIEGFKPWLAARPGQNKPRVTTATITHRLGTLRMLFLRTAEWGRDDAPPGADLPR